MWFKHSLLACSLMIALVFMQFAWMSLAFSGCSGSRPDSVEVIAGVDDLLTPVACTIDAPRYPTTPGDMVKVYAGRTFLADGNHLGRDLALAEGTPIYAAGCGIVRIYRSASGYGQLVVVIEHRLAVPLNVTNGKGEAVTIGSFVTIYGHLRVSQDRAGSVGVLGIRSGDMVGPDDVVGYVDQDATNGDGDVHLHFGVRLQTAQDAATTDVNWFRGYDTTPSQRGWYADPLPFMEALTSSVMPVTWHPAGTVLVHASDNAYWMVDADGNRHLIDQATLQNEQLASRAIAATESEFACLAASSSYVSPRATSQLVKFNDASTVYEYSGLGPGNWRRSFVSYEAFQSWGWRDDQIGIWPASQRASFFAQTEDRGFRTLREGTLVKADSESEVSVVSEDRRLPISDWPTFLALGYRQEQIVTVPKSTIDIVAGPRGPLITPALVAQCAHPSSCISDCGPATQGGGTGEEIPTVPPGKILFRYDGSTMGPFQFRGMWDPSGSAFYDWVPSTFALCPDSTPSDSRLECLLDMPSGTQNFLFTVQLSDGRWWGDVSCSSSGGCGSTVGSVTLFNATGEVSYDLLPNGSGSTYVNGFVASIP